MYNTTLLILEKEIESTQMLLDGLIDGYGEIAKTASLKRDVESHLDSENCAYRNIVSGANLLIAGNAHANAVDMPYSLDDLSTEAFKARVKEISGSVWKAITETYHKLVKLLKNWWEKITGRSSDVSVAIEEEISKIDKAINESDRLAEENDIKRGDVIDKETLEKVDSLIFVDNKKRYVSREDIETDLTLVFSKGTEIKMLNRFVRDGKLDDIGANVKMAIEVMKQLASDKFNGKLSTYVRTLTNIRNRDELVKFIDNDLQLTSDAMKELIDEKRLDGSGKIVEGERYLSKEIIAGERLTMTIRKVGNFYSPYFLTKQSSNKYRNKEMPAISLKTLADVARCASEVTTSLTDSKRSFAAMETEFSELMAGNGKRLSEINETISSVATAREEKEVKAIAAELKQMASIFNTVASCTMRLAEHGKSISGSLHLLSKEVGVVVVDNYLAKDK